MNFRLTSILFGLVLLIGLALVIRLLMTGDETPEGTLIPSLAQAKADEIDEVVLEKADPAGTLKFHRTGKDASGRETWEITEPLHAKADGPAVKAIVEAVLRVKPAVFREQIPTAAIANLTPPSLKVTLRQGSERSGTLNIGKVSYGGPGAILFVSTDKNPERVIPVSRSELDSLFVTAKAAAGGPAGDLAKWTDDYRDKNVFPAESMGLGSEVTYLDLSLPNKKKELALSQVPPSGWKFDQPAGWGAADPSGDISATPGTTTGFTGVRPLLMALLSVKATGPTDFVDSPKDMKEYGLNPDNPDLVRVVMKTKDSGAATVFIGKKTESDPAAAAAIGKVWVRIEGQPGVIRATAGDLNGLPAIIENPDPLRDRTLLTVEKSRIDGLDITVGGQTTKLRRTGAIPEWKLYGNPAAGDPQPANNIAVMKLLDLLTERRTIKAFPGPNPANFAAPEIKSEIKLWADGFEPVEPPKADAKAEASKAEPKEKGKPTTLLFGRKEGDGIYVRRTNPDGQVAEYLLSDKIAVAGQVEELLPVITRTRLDYLDTNLKSFSPTVVSKVTVSGVKNFELEKKEEKKDEKKPFSPTRDKWLFVLPADQKGKTADTYTVDEMLRILGTTHSVTKFVDETPTPAKLAEYGLAPPAMPVPNSPPAPRLKVVIDLKTDDPEKQRTYEFGTTTGDQVYVRIPGKPAVFTLPKFVYEKFADSDLRDKAIFEFNPSEITGVEMKGWKSLTGQPMTLTFERDKDNAWKVTTPAGWPLDPPKLDTFLTTLSSTTVKTYLQGTPTPEQGLDVNQDALEVTLKTAKGPLLTVKIGNATEMGKAYFATASTLPPAAPVFTIDSEKLKPYKEKPTALAK